MNLKFWSTKNAPQRSSFEREFASIQQAHQTNAGLASWVQRLTQEVVVLQRVLYKNGLLKESEFREAMKETMIDDHYSGGVNGWLKHTTVPFTQDEGRYLQMRFGFTDDEIKKFHERVEEVDICT